MAQSVRAQAKSITERVLKDPTDENIERAIEDLKKMSAAATDPQDMVAADWALEFMVGLAEDLGLDPSKAAKHDEGSHD
jgi:hypothetical protein